MSEGDADPSAVAADRDSRHVWHPWSPVRAAGPRLMVARGEGYRLWDIDGKQYIDATSAALSASCGHSHPDIRRTIAEQAATLQHYDLSVGSHEPAGRLAERLAGLLPGSLSRVLFVNSGSEGVEAAVLMATWYSALLGRPRNRVVSFARGYHGATVVSRSLSGLPPLTHPMREPFPATRVELTASNRDVRSPEQLPQLLAAFERAFDDPADRPAAVVVEPVLNVGGGIVLPQGFLRGLRELCDATQTLLIVDEVFTGCGRTGRMFAAEHDGVEPDIAVVSKGLSGGYVPITAVAVRPQLHDGFSADPIIGGLRYGHTSSGHAVACAAALATLDVLERERLPERADRHGRDLLSRLEPLAGKGFATDVRGLGLVVTLEAGSVEAATALVVAARGRGLLLRQQGPNVMVVPPLIIDEEGLSAITDGIEESLAELA